MPKLLSLSYLFDATPGQEFRYFWLCFIFFLLLMAIGQYLRIMIKGSTHKKILKRLLPNVTTHLTWIALFGFIFLFFRYEDMPYLAMRIWLIAMILLGFYKLGKIGYIYTKILPQEIDKQYESVDKKKYLPTGKKNKKKRR
ncbi:hypothetical protein COT83_02430 [Candidatus Peregrinibacteria bacterium CG10_big_fil_rev_8_21_14_0_10_44_7]|nr:MAG: hypothetical protein AUK45_01735 [Candidatus Peregrinibacteria bacterium CG2_30_44_17]PIS04103.1 MAG: hypothetical protein COT83_02430 [Candidatus Peregrinibacteria bacterium CG10_big_fil_rev_8_21_14_0_10_44_7]PIX80311.1 MAG: hypothetical protein COZ35_01175 [Candidatus Peregrinibacteria bacterium CG_4_10_14_3_um_filter_44_21]PJB89397.1 MAG: hypothetical protein CO082_01250 [Candidatus Peregrinibacteria bacterium CG_4_9_14_0_8_um_filter_44_15]